MKPDKKADPGRRWPGYLLGGRLRTSTLVLIVAFVLVWWTYDAYRPEPEPPTPQVVPPGFIPDPSYTWVPRTRVQRPPATTTETVTPTTTTTTPETTTPTSPGPLPPPFPFPPPPPGLGPPPPGPPPSPVPSPSPPPGAPSSPAVTTAPPRP